MQARTNLVAFTLCATALLQLAGALHSIPSFSTFDTSGRPHGNLFVSPKHASRRPLYRSEPWAKSKARSGSSHVKLQEGSQVSVSLSHLGDLKQIPTPTTITAAPLAAAVGGQVNVATAAPSALATAPPIAAPPATVPPAVQPTLAPAEAASVAAAAAAAAAAATAAPVASAVPSVAPSAVAPPGVPAVTAAPVASAVTAAPAAATVSLTPAPRSQAAATTVTPKSADAVPPAAASTEQSAPSSADSPPYLEGPSKILVYGLFFAVLYLSIWIARLPAEKRPAAVDEGLMRWIEDQEEEEPSGGMNCVLVRIKSVSGLPSDMQPASVTVDCSAFKKSLTIGETDFESDGVWETCFVGPLIDQEQSRTVTMQAAKPEVKFTVRSQAPGKPKDVAQATLKASADAGSSSSASSAGGGMARGQWCTQELKLQPAGSGALGAMKRGVGAVAGSSLGTLSVEVKALQVNAAGKALLKSNYYVIALRNEFKKPYSACARSLAVALMGMLTLTSLPMIGDMFNGCFYLSMHGLSTSGTLFCMAIPHWAKLFHIQLPSWVKAMSLDSLRTAGATLWTMGSSGIWMAYFWGLGQECSNHFRMLEVLLMVDSALFTYAWWKGEGGGLMGLLNG